MKKIILLLVWLCATFVMALESSKISMIVGTSKSITAPFIIDSYKVIPKSDKVQIEATDSQLRVMANSIGEFLILVEGAGLKKEYSISVKSNLTKTLKQLRTDLDVLTELDVSINEENIVIKGEISNPEHWSFLERVLSSYSGKVINYATFRPTEQTVKNLRKMLKDAGFIFANEGKSPNPGEIAMVLSQDAVTISGELYSNEDVAKMRKILSTQKWLSVDGNSDGAKGLVRGIVNLSVVETILQVDIVYVGVSDSDLKRLGTPGTPSLSFGVDYLYRLLSNRGTERKTATFGGNMDATVSFLAKNGISRNYNAGHVSFLNNSPEGGKLHTGGTIYAKVNGIENGSLQNIQYGLTINVKGGLVSATKARLDLDLVNSYLLGASEDSYNLSEDSSRQTIVCELNKTIAIAGYKKIVQDTQKSGLPILRNTPVLKWFVSENSTQEGASQLLVLVCPRIQNLSNSPQIEIPLDVETGKTYETARRDAESDLDAKGRKNPESKSWLDWFRW